MDMKSNGVKTAILNARAVVDNTMRLITEKDS
jgi:hypothetical protein